jgi:hypothetical protein
VRACARVIAGVRNVVLVVGPADERICRGRDLSELPRPRRDGDALLRLVWHQPHGRAGGTAASAGAHGERIASATGG